MTSTLHDTQGFKVVGIKFNEGSTGVHQLLWKQHTIRTHSESKPPDRTLFVVNVPPYCTEESFKRAFSKFGRVNSVFFHKKPTSADPVEAKFPHFSPITAITGFKVAYVVFAKSSSVKAAMKVSPGTVLVASSQDKPVLTGVKKWQQVFNAEYVPQDTLKESIKDVMEEYDRKKEKEKSGGQSEPDDDGWVTVTSQKKKKPQLEKVDELKLKKRKKKKRKQDQFNFYSFQNRQAKMDHVAHLRKKFEEDKKRISMMKAARKFKPY